MWPGNFKVSSMHQQVSSNGSSGKAAHADIVQLLLLQCSRSGCGCALLLLLLLLLVMVRKRAVQQCTQVPTQTAVISAMSDRKRTVNAMQRPGGDRNPPKATDAPSSCPALNDL
jgi:hypothetical protein